MHISVNISKQRYVLHIRIEYVYFVIKHTVEVLV